MSNIIRDRKADLVRLFEHALEQTAQAFDERPGLAQQAPPMFVTSVEFRFADGLRIISIPAHDMKEPVPNPIPAPVAKLLQDVG
jgi:hypothetical protein